MTLKTYVQHTSNSQRIVTDTSHSFVKYFTEVQSLTFPHQNSPSSATERQRFRSSRLTVLHSGDLEDGERCQYVSVLHTFTVKTECVLQSKTPLGQECLLACICHWKTSLGGWRCVSSVIESFLPIAPVSFPLSFAPWVPQTDQPHHFSLV